MASPSEFEESSTTTRVIKNRLKHKWVLSDFPLYYLDLAKEMKANTMPASFPLVSEPFACSMEPQLEFAMHLYPKGFNAETKDYLSFCLKGPPSNVSVHFTLFILTEQQEKIESLKFTHMFTANRRTFGCPTLIKHKVLLDSSNGFLQKDTLTLLGEVLIYLKPSCRQKHQIQELEALKRWSIEDNSRVYGNLLQSGHLSDAVLPVAGTFGSEETRLDVHRAILAAHSPVFAAMFQCEMSESSDGRVVIDDLSGDALKKLLEFTYTGKAEFSEEIAEELLHAADKYEVDKLKNICGLFLCGKVTLETVIRLLILADRHSVDNLKSSTVEFIRLHMAELALDDNWPLIDKLVVEELRKQDSRKDTTEGKAKNFQR